MNRTSIEWARNQDGTPGLTSNPVRGECPVGCSYCYVKSFRQRYGWHKDIRLYPEELNRIVCRKKPAGIFLGSTIELFHDKTIQYMPCIMDCIKASPQHRFYLLTKCPQNLPKEFPENCWVGVSVTSNQMYREAIVALSIIKARVKYLSFEPLLEYIPLAIFNSFIDWIIIGAMTGTKADLLPFHHKTGLIMVKLSSNRWSLQPQIEWIQEIVQAADKAGISVFLKNNLMPLTKPVYELAGCIDNFFIGGDGITPILRQEMPIDN